MPNVTIDGLRSIPYRMAPVGITITHNAHPHYVHDPTVRVRQTVTKDPNNNVRQVALAVDPAGDTIYLPYRPNEIHSVQLAANPLPGGATNFLTANLDGCCMFIDVKTTGNVVVYHANASTGVAPTPQQSASQPWFQTLACVQELDREYTAAAVHYNGTANANHQRLLKARYLQAVGHRLLQKTAAGRTGLQFGGGVEHASFTTFAGFFVNNRWEFWFQTYSQFIYQRPVGHWKSKLGFRDIDPDPTHNNFRIMECTQFYRCP